MTVESERTYLMKNNFIKLHEDGYSIPEIAKVFNLSPASVYRHLQEIADANGRSRSDLLKVVHSMHNIGNIQRENEHFSMTFDALLDSIESAEKQTKYLIDQIYLLLEEENDEDQRR